MTLAIAMKYNDEVWLVADTQYSHNLSTFKSGPKLFEVDVDLSIHNTDHALCRKYNHKIGFAFAGDVYESISIVEILRIGLTELNHIEIAEPFSFKLLVDYIYEIINDYSSQYLTQMGTSFSCGIFVCGYCPSKMQDVCYQIEAKNNIINLPLEIITSNDVEITMGDTAACIDFDAAMNNSRIDGDIKPPIDELLKIIADPKYNTVGGTVQIGCMKNNNFEIYGINAIASIQGGNNLTSVSHYYLGFDFNSLKNYNFARTGRQIIIKS